MKVSDNTRSALPASRGFGLTLVCIAGMVTFGFIYAWGDDAAKSTGVDSGAVAKVMKVAPDIAASFAGVDPSCSAVVSTNVNPYGHTKVPCVNDDVDRTHIPPTASIEKWHAEQRAASQEVVDSIPGSRNRTAKAFEVLNQAIKCHEGMSAAQVDQCVIVFGAERQAVASLAQFASSGDIVAKFELSRLIFKEQMGAGVTESWILSAIDKTLPADSEDWNARALQMLKDAAAQGHPTAVDQLQSINRGEGFLID